MAYKSISCKFSTRPRKGLINHEMFYSKKKAVSKSLYAVICNICFFNIIVVKLVYTQRLIILCPLPDYLFN